MRPTIKDLRESGDYNKPEDRFYKKNFIRKLSIYLTWVFLRLGVTANQITILSVFVGAFGTLFLISENPIYWILGWGILQLYNILDSSDGQVARYSKTLTKYGDYLDDLAHVIIESFIFIMMTLGLYKIFNNILVFVLGFSAMWCIMMFHLQHLLHKRIVKKPKGRKTVGLGHIPFFKRISNTTNMIINSVFIVALLDLVFPIFKINFITNFRLLLLVGCGVLFPLIFIRKFINFRKLISNLIRSGQFDNKLK